jgi:hypothetical protein
VNDFVLYLNLWGTTAKLWEKTPGDDLFPDSDLLSCQRHFTRTLHELVTQGPESRSPELKAVQMGDLAYVTSSDPEELLLFGAQILQKMTIETCGETQRFRLWPLRGAIARGVEANAFNWPETKKFLGAAIPGPGSIEAAYLEKSAQKGMRLFLTDEVQKQIPHHHAPIIRSRQTRGTEHFEINWMKAPTGETPYLDRRAQAQSLREHLQRTSRELIEVESNYFQQLGASFADLLSWTQGRGA